MNTVGFCAQWPMAIGIGIAGAIAGAIAGCCQLLKKEGDPVVGVQVQVRGGFAGGDCGA